MCQKIAQDGSTLVSKAEFHPVNFVISDMSMPGNPMIYVNQTFCSTTGYEKYEAQGRNCRFLQGPATEPESVAVIQDTLRRGADCHVRISNYRKDGSMFVNLLTMRPIHDSNNVYRYCIGVQFELSPSVPIKEQATTLDNLIQLIPIQIEVSSQRTGAMHRRTELNAESTTELAVKLERAMAGDGALAAHSLEARNEAGMKLRNNHERVLKDVCNASPDTNIDGKPLTQLGLVRVPPEHEALADAALTEIERRLLGEGWSEAQTDEIGRVWAMVATYLDGRIQSTPGEKAGRHPDLSPPLRLRCVQCCSSWNGSTSATFMRIIVRRCSSTCRQQR